MNLNEYFSKSIHQKLLDVYVEESNKETSCKVSLSYNKDM